MINFSAYLERTVFYMFSNEFMWHELQKSNVEKRARREALQNGNKRVDSFAAEACNENPDTNTQRGHH